MIQPNENHDAARTAAYFKHSILRKKLPFVPTLTVDAPVVDSAYASSFFHASFSFTEAPSARDAASVDASSACAGRRLVGAWSGASASMPYCASENWDASFVLTFAICEVPCERRADEKESGESEECGAPR